MRIIGVDPGSVRTGFGCIDTDGTRHRVIVCGTISPPARTAFPEKLLAIHRELSELLVQYEPSGMAIEDIFYAKNARSALKLGHVRGVLLLAASEASLPVWEYSPTEVKRAVVGYGRAEKQQVQQMVTLLLGMDDRPSPFDVSDALAVAICHSHLLGPTAERPTTSQPRSWRRYRPEPQGRS